MKAYLRLAVLVIAVTLGMTRHLQTSASVPAQVVQTTDEDQHEPISAQAPSATPSLQVVAPASDSGSGSVVLQRASNGHFYADVTINGVPVHALVDTGATAVSFNKGDAARIGISPAAGDFTAAAMTANGETHFAPVTLSSVSFGPFTRTNIPAAVMDTDMGPTLLGMTFLSKFKLRIDGDTMVLS